jgi:probable rRNA maturation factor
MSISIQSTVLSYPKLPYESMSRSIVGTSYNLTLVFVGETRAQALNKTHRNASYIPNVLSFPLDSKTGEIYITPRIAAKEASKFNMTYEGYVGFLFIHGLLHLKGYDHGDTMEKAERRYVQKFSLR